MTWPYLRMASPWAMAAAAILWPAGISRSVMREMEPLRESPAARGRLATATLSLSRRRRAKSSKRSGIGVFYLIKRSAERHNDELMSRELSQDQWIASAVVEFEGPLIVYAARILGDMDRARDVVQETFLRLCGQEQEAVRPHLLEWLYAVCRNRALDLLRRSRTRAHEQLSAEMVACPDARPVKRGGEGELAGRILGVMGELPENQRAVLAFVSRRLSSRETVASVKVVAPVTEKEKVGEPILHLMPRLADSGLGSCLARAEFKGDRAGDVQELVEAVLQDASRVGSFRSLRLMPEELVVIQ